MQRRGPAAEALILCLFFLLSCLPMKAQAAKRRPGRSVATRISTLKGHLLEQPNDPFALVELRHHDVALTQRPALLERYRQDWLKSGKKPLQGFLYYGLMPAAQSRPLFEKLAKAHPQSPWGPIGLADLHLAAGRSTEALVCVQEALKRDPTCAMAFAHKGCMLIGRKDVTGGRAAFAKALALRPKLAILHLRVSVSMGCGLDGGSLTTGWRRKEADAAIERALALDNVWQLPSLRPLAFNIRSQYKVFNEHTVAFGRGTIAKECFHHLRAYLTMNPSSSHHRFLLALGLSYDEKYAEAIQILAHPSCKGQYEGTKKGLQRALDLVSPSAQLRATGDGVMFRMRPRLGEPTPAWLLGDFNGWQRQGAALVKGKDGWLSIRLKLSPGRWRFGLASKTKPFSVPLWAPELDRGCGAFRLDVGRVRTEPADPFTRWLMLARHAPPIAFTPARRGCMLAIAQRPLSADALAALATVYRKAGRLDDMVADFMDARPPSSSRDNAVALLQALIHVQENRLDEARPLVEQAAKGGVSGAGLLSLQALTASDPRQGETLAARAIIEDSVGPWPILSVETLATTTGALSALKKPALSGRDARLTARYIELLLKANRFDEVEPVFERVGPRLALDGPDPWFSILRAADRDSCSPEDRKQLCRGAETGLSHFPHARAFLDRYVDASLADGRGRHALTLIQPLLKKHPTSAPLHLATARLLEILGRPGQAQGHYDRVLKLAPGWSHPHFFYGWFLLDRGDLGRARVHFEATLRQNPGEGKTYRLLGQILLKEGKKKTRCELFQRALRHVDDSKQLCFFHRELAEWNLFVHGDYAKGLHHARAAVALAERHSPSHLGTAWIPLLFAGAVNQDRVAASRAFGHLRKEPLLIGIMVLAVLFPLLGLAFIVIVSHFLFRRARWLRPLQAALAMWTTIFAIQLVAGVIAGGLLFDRWGIFLSQGSVESGWCQLAAYPFGAMGMILLPGCWLLWRHQPLSVLGLSRLRAKKDLGWGLLGGGLALLAGVGLNHLLVRFWPPSGLGKFFYGENIAPGWIKLAKTPAGAVAIFFVVVILAPLAEEIFFRGFLYGRLRQSLGKTVAGLGTALFFSAVHIMCLVPLFVVGLVLAWIYEKSQSLWPCVLTHFCLNLAGFLALLYAAPK